MLGEEELVDEVVERGAVARDRPEVRDSALRAQPILVGAPPPTDA